MVKENVASCLKVIAAETGLAGRGGSAVILVAVTKTVALPFIYEALDSGIENIGENRVQEAFSKYEALNEYARKIGRKLVWHMIGHLQTNKVRGAVRIFDLIHSVDSLRIAAEIDRQAAGLDKIQDILVEINVSGESGKYGLSPAEAALAIEKMGQFSSLRVKGLMTVPPVVRQPDEARPYFRVLRELRDQINRLSAQPFTPLEAGRHIPLETESLTGHRRTTVAEGNLPLTGLTELSMGMSADFRAAIEEGATMVRIGRAIFGERS